MDFEQLFDFARIFAQADNPHIRHLMYEQFSACISDDTGATQIIDLDGIDGFHFVAARLGEAAHIDPRFADNAGLLRQLKERTSNITTDADIAALGVANPAVQRYLDVVAETETTRQQASQRRPDMQNQPYAALKEYLLSKQITKQKKLSIFQIKKWGMQASDKDFSAAAYDLLQQTEPRYLVSYLNIFVQRAFPLDFQLLLPFARHENERVARWTLDALSLFRSPALRDVALQLLQDHWHVGSVLGLFVLNYQLGDEKIFIALLDAAQTHEEVHSLSYGLVDVLAQNTIPQALTLQSMIYERQPCSLCRTNVVQQLIAAQSIPAWMIEECRYDADEDTRSAVAS